MSSYQDGKTFIVGDGESLISFTATDDITSYLAYVLTSTSLSTTCPTFKLTQISTTAVPLSKLVNRQLNIEGSRKSFNQLAAVLKTKAPSLTIEYQPIDVAYKAWTEKHDFLSFIRATWAEGQGLVAKNPAETDNGLYPDWHPKSVETFISV